MSKSSSLYIDFDRSEWSRDIANFALGSQATFLVGVGVREGNLAKLWRADEQPIVLSDHEVELIEHLVRSLEPSTLQQIKVSGHPYLDICVPNGLIRNPRGSVIGISIPYYPPDHFQEMAKFIEFEARESGQTPSLTGVAIRTTLSLAREICQRVALAHKRGFIIGDLSPRNFLVSKTMKVVSVDIDSWTAVKHHETKPSRLSGYHTPGYVAPEVLKGEDFSKASDCFVAGGILIPTLLFGGIHPFDGKSKSAAEVDCFTLDHRILNDYFWPLDPSSYIFNGLPIRWGLSSLPEKLAEAILRSLARQPSKRCKIGQMIEATTHAISLLKSCESCSRRLGEPHADEWFQGHVCPLCGDLVK